jgi:hypothetical protein
VVAADMEAHALCDVLVPRLVAATRALRPNWGWDVRAPQH